MPSTYSNLNSVLKSGQELEAISMTNLYLSCPREEMQKSCQPAAGNVQILGAGDWETEFEIAEESTHR